MPLPTTSPSQAGIDAQGILDLLDAAAHLDLHSIAIAREGQVVARGWWAPYAADRVHLVYSCSKSLTASTIATLVRDGLLGLDDPILDHLPPDVLDGVDIADVWQRVTVRHCLTMTVGHTAEAWQPDLRREGDLLRAVLLNPPDAEPGSVFAYNQVATYLLSRAAEHRGGAPLVDLARERVLAPLGSTTLEWHRDDDGHSLGFSGAHVLTDDLLSLAQLWLDGGRTPDGTQLLPAGWVDDAARPFLEVPEDPDSDWAQGYGQSFWIARHGYRGDGAYGQYAIVLPEQRVVVAITSEVVDMQEPLDLLWTHLLPAIDRAGSGEADAALAARLAELSIPALSASGTAPEQRTFPVDPASDLDPAYTAVTISEDGGTVTLTRAGVEHTIAAGDGEWLLGEISDGERHLPVVASGGWTADGYRAEVRVVETPHRFRIATGPAGALLTWQCVPLGGADPLQTAVR